MAGAAVVWDSAVTVVDVGASGAVSGVLGAYLILHPRANIRVFVVLIIFITVVNLPAFIVLGFWFGGQLLSSAMADPSQPGVAFLAHIGGFVLGMVLTWIFMIFVPQPSAYDRQQLLYERTRRHPY